MAINSLSTGWRPGVCTSSTRPTAPYEGQQIYETDTDKMLVWNGSAWLYSATPQTTEIGAWETWTPVLTASTTNPTLGSGSVASGKYAQINKLVIANFLFSFGTSPNAGSGTYRISLPITPKTTSQVFQQNELGSILMRDASTQAAGFAYGYITNTNYFIMAYQPPTYFVSALENVTNAAPWTWGASDTLSGQIIYEAA